MLTGVGGADIGWCECSWPDEPGGGVPGREWIRAEVGGVGLPPLDTPGVDERERVREYRAAGGGRGMTSDMAFAALRGDGGDEDGAVEMRDGEDERPRRLRAVERRGYVRAVPMLDGDLRR